MAISNAAEVTRCPGEKMPRDRGVRGPQAPVREWGYSLFPFKVQWRGIESVAVSGTGERANDSVLR